VDETIFTHEIRWVLGLAVMEASGAAGDSDVRERSAVFQIEIEDGPSSGQEQTMQADSVLKSLSPLINTMRAFGLYFTRGHDQVQEPTSQPVREGVRRCSNWNAGRIYATIMLAVTWLNAVRFSAVFDGKETFGAVLFAKIIFIPGSLLIAILHTAYYVASHSGSLDRVFSQADWSVAEHSPKYSRRAKVLTVVCWILLILDVVIEAYLLFAYDSNLLLLLLITTFQIPKLCVHVIKVVFVVLYLLATASWAFPQALNYILRCASHCFQFLSSKVCFYIYFWKIMNAHFHCC